MRKVYQKAIAISKAKDKRFIRNLLSEVTEEVEDVKRCARKPPGPCAYCLLHHEKLSEDKALSYDLRISSANRLASWQFKA